MPWSVQDSIAERGEANGGLKLRIGINLGDIIIEDDGDVYGDGVNVAARLEQMADPGGVLISGKIYEEVEGKVERTVREPGRAAGQEYSSTSESLCAGRSDALRSQTPKAAAAARQALHRCAAVH